MSCLADDLRDMATTEGSYAVRRLVSHLAGSVVKILERDPRAVQVSHLDYLHRLITEPAWMEAHVAEDRDYIQFLDDVQSVWRVADKVGEIALQTNHDMIGCQVHYALMQTSIHSLIRNIPTKMLLVGIQLGRWSAKAAVAYAKQDAHAVKKVSALTQIAAFLREKHEDELAHEVLTDALVGLRDIEASSDFVQALTSLVPYLPPDMLIDAFFLAQEIPRGEDCMKVVRELCPRLPPEWQEEVLSLVGELSDSTEEAMAMAALAPRLHKGFLYTTLDRIQRSSPWPKAQARALVALASRLPGKLIYDALAVARTIENPLYRTAALLAFPQDLDPQSRVAMVRNSVIAAWEFLDIDECADAIELMAPYLPTELLHEIFMHTITLGAGEVGGGSFRAKALKALGPHLPAELQRQLIDIVRSPAVSSFWASDILAALVPHLPQEMLSTALAGARGIIQADLFNVRTSSVEASAVPKALLTIVPRLRSDLITEALLAVQELKGTNARCFALAELIPYLPALLLPKALEMAKEITEPENAIYHTLPLSVLAEYGALSAFDSALDIVSRAQYGDEGVIFLPVLLAMGASLFVSTQPVSSLDSRVHRSTFVNEAFASARNIMDPRYRSEALAEIAALIPEIAEIALDEAHKAAYEKVELYTYQDSALYRLIPALPFDKRAVVLNQLVTVAQNFRDAYRNDDNGDIGVKRNLSSLLGPFLRGKQRRNPYNAARSDLSMDPLQPLINIMRGLSAPVCIEGLAQLALNLPDLTDNGVRTVVSAALDVAKSVDEADSYNVGISLAKLTSRVPTDLYAPALALARRMQSPHALAALVPYASANERQCMLDEALTVAGVRSTGEKVNIPVTLLPYLLPYLPYGRQLEELQTALAELQQMPRHGNWEDFRQTLRPIVKAWSQLPYPQAYALWKSTLHRFAAYPREYLLAALSELVPVVRALGGTTAVVESIRSVLEVCRQRRWSLGSAQNST